MTFKLGTPGAGFAFGMAHVLAFPLHAKSNTSGPDSSPSAGSPWLGYPGVPLTAGIHNSFACFRFGQWYDSQASQAIGGTLKHLATQPVAKWGRVAVCAAGIWLLAPISITPIWAQSQPSGPVGSPAPEKLGKKLKTETEM